MTKLNERKSVLKFETIAAVMDQGMRNVMVEVRPSYIKVWAKGLRSSYVVDWASIYSLAVKASLEKK